jgi:hypothetical protein
MQIEENIRDSKSLPFGMGAEIARSRSAPRPRTLLQVGSLASYLLWHLGQLAETRGLHCRYTVTTRTGRKMSIIAVAILLCAERIIAFTPHGVRALRGKLGIEG